jgi:hypothetical protein
MKKINYMAPEMEVIELANDNVLLSLDVSNGGGDPNVHNTSPDPDMPIEIG